MQTIGNYAHVMPARIRLELSTQIVFLDTRYQCRTILEMRDSPL